MHAEFCKTNLTKYKQIKMFIHIHTFILMILGLNVTWTIYLFPVQEKHTFISTILSLNVTIYLFPAHSCQQDSNQTNFSHDSSFYSCFIQYSFSSNFRQ
jgi:hypothetical protein